jgi:hypothetical protein
MSIEVQTIQAVPFSFEGIELSESCTIDGVPHFSARAIGEFLGYEPSRANDIVRNLVSRNPHIQNFSADIKLMSPDGKAYNTRVYDPCGLQLIVINSGTKLGANLQISLVNLGFAYMKGELTINAYPHDPTPKTVERSFKEFTAPVAEYVKLLKFKIKILEKQCSNFKSDSEVNDKPKQKQPSQRQKWLATREEIANQTIKILWEENLSVVEIAEKAGMSVGAVLLRAANLDLPPKHKPGY